MEDWQYIYISKKLASPSDVDIINFASCNSDPMQGEFLTIEIKLKNRKNLIICNMYRLPSGNIENFLEKLDQTLKQLHRHRNKQIVFASDSNIDLLKYGHSDNTTKLVDIFSEHGFAPLISRLTRITNHSASLIDHISGLASPQGRPKPSRRCVLPTLNMSTNNIQQAEIT